MSNNKTKTSRVSKGERETVNRKLVNAVRREKPYGEKLMSQLKYWGKGRRTMVTIENPNKNETNKRFIRVEGNDPKAFGPWKRIEKQDN